MKKNQMELSGETDYRTFVKVNQELEDYTKEKQLEYLEEILKLSGETSYKFFKYAFDNQKYFNSPLAAFIHIVCRRDMNSGDIDSIIWDYKYQPFYYLESKRLNEAEKPHQKWLHEEMSKKTKINDCDFNYFKIEGNPPYTGAIITKYEKGKTDYNSAFVSFAQLIDFLELKITFEDLIKQ